MSEPDRKRPGQTLPRRLLAFLGITPGRGGSDIATSTTVLDTTAPGFAPSSLHPLSPRLAQRYQIERILGYGGYGMVYLVRDLVIGRLAALKILNTHLLQDKAIFEHFLQEARIAGQIDHENIVVIYNVEIDADTAAIVMEYLSDGSLASRLAEHGRLPPAEALPIARGILSGLAAAHRMKVIHRDIKPANILFDPRGRAKISDFGIARFSREQSGSATSGSLGIVGTPQYMAPEQLRDDDTIDGRADLYSLGVILYEMLSGHRPCNFDANLHAHEIARLITRMPPMPLHSLNPALDIALCQFVHRLLEPDPDQRPGSANEALQLLQPFIITGARDAFSRLQQEQRATAGEQLLEDVLRMMLTDGFMAAAERRLINQRAHRLGVPLETARALEERVRSEMELPSLADIESYEEAYTIMAAGGPLSDSQKATLRAGSRKLRLSVRECELIEEQIQKRMGQSQEHAP